LIVIQRRGTGVSDRSPDGRFATPQECVPDTDAVLRDVGATRVSLVGWGHGGQLALAYAAARPERVAHVVAVNGYARLMATSDYPCGHAPQFLETFLGLMTRVWGQERPMHPIFDPISAEDPQLIAKIARFNRLTASPRDAVDIQRAVNGFDVRDVLPQVRCPVLVAVLRNSVTGVDNARFLAEHLPAAECAKYVELDGHFVPNAAQSAELARAIGAFLHSSE
jgi:pimeloyl-ACP methyl ester carboxylesterase